MNRLWLCMVCSLTGCVGGSAQMAAGMESDTNRTDA